MKPKHLESAGARPAEQFQIHIARRSAGSTPTEPNPIWLAVLLATECEAQRNGENHTVRWNCVSGRALYTNAGRDVEHIEPLGVRLLGGHTMAVCWMPGETAYTVEVYRQTELCA